MTTRSSSPKTDLDSAFRRCRGIFAAVLMLSLVINLLLFTPSLYMLQVYDRVLTTASGETLVMLTLIAAAALLVMAFIEAIRARLLVRAGVRLDALLEGRVFAAVFRSTAGRQAGSGTSGGTQPLGDLACLREFLSGGAVATFCDVPWVPIFLLVMFLFHPVLGMVSTAGAVVLFGLALANELATRQPLREAGKAGLDSRAFAEAGLRDAEALAAMGMVPGLQRRWSARHASSIGLHAMAMDRAGLLAALGKPLRLGLQVAILGAGAWLAIERQITPGTMIAASIIMSRALAPVEMAVGHWKGFLQARTAYARLQALLRAVPAEAERLPLPAPTGALALEQVVAAPPGARTAVLKGVSFRLAPGEVLGVIGPSGAGKSTLGRVLVGVWPLASGSVRLDGADLGQWSPDALGQHLGYLPQDVQLFDGTIAENIARLATLVDAGEVLRAARRAGVHEMILRLPQGYDTRLGAGGLILSGGQRQRIGLARALYGNPPLVVLDEPNANLDGEGEQALLAALAGLKRDRRTAVIITHRTNLLVAVDKVLILRDGAVLACGARDAILAGPGAGPSREAPAAGTGRATATAPAGETLPFRRTDPAEAAG